MRFCSLARARRFVAVLLAGDISKVCDSRLTRRFESIFAHRPSIVQRMDGAAFSNNTYLCNEDLSLQHDYSNSTNRWEVFLSPLYFSQSLALAKVSNALAQIPNSPFLPLI